MKKFLCIAFSVLSLAYLPALGMGASYAQEDRYALDFVQGGTIQGYEERDVYYATKSEDVYVNPYQAPSFGASKANACAVEAGGNAIVYYDRIFDELIPDYKHRYVWGGFTYGSQNAAINNMFDTLYDMMGTESRGTTIPGFKSGMEQYVQSKNHNINITQATGSFHNVNIDFLKEQLQEEKLAAMFLDTFSLTAFGGFDERDGYDHVMYDTFGGQHVVLVYGYRDIVYYNEDGSVKERNVFLYSSTGYVNAYLSWVDITNFCNVDDIYILEIV